MATLIKPKDVKREDVKGVECRHVCYAKAEDGKSDLHVAKTYIHLKDGTRFPKLILRKNYEREVWVTREGFRNHKDKKEYENEKYLQCFKTPQYKMLETISRALYGKPYTNTTYKRLATSPYLYGTDIDSTCLIKHDYNTKFPDCLGSPAEVAVLDIETDVIKGTGEIILITLSYKDRIVTAINTDFLPASYNPIERIEAIVKKELGDILKPRNAKVEYILCDTPGKCCAEIMKKAHEWMPDFITIWNIDYDLPKIEEALVKENFDLAEVFSDPCVPKEYRHYKYVEGPKQKVTQGGDVFPLHWADQWHYVDCPASFYFIDSACLYKRLRIAKGMEPSYSLDSILKKHIGVGKLDVEGLEELEGLAWHIKMQKEYPFHYVAYNIFDCVGVELLDEKTGDISNQLEVLSGISHYKNFNKNPRRIVDDMHFYYREMNDVIATTGAEVRDEEKDELVVGLDKWIVTLPAANMSNTGLDVIEELPEVRSSIFIHNADIDIEGTYPNIGVVANTAKETTLREMSAIEGLNEDQKRELGINISGGKINAIEIAVTALGLPTLTQWGDIYDKVKGS